MRAMQKRSITLHEIHVKPSLRMVMVIANNQGMER
jgi:hypothetical protein